MTGPVIAKIVGFANGQPTPFDGEYVVEYRPDGDLLVERLGPHRIHLITTPFEAEATRYSFESWHRTWRLVSKTQPRRPWDGKPNRPLTAFNVEITSA
jgi:hypothetical protein